MNNLRLQKLKPLRSKKLLDGAKGEPCVRCGDDYGVASCHYTGYRQHAYGKGRGIKCSDLMSAYLCWACHRYFDDYLRSDSKNHLYSPDTAQFRKLANDIYPSEEFLHLITLTNIRRIEQGILIC